MNNEKVKYSFVLPVYNGLEYLPTCINTVINQNYANYELIIVDDCSTDGTRDYLSQLEHPNIKVVFQEKNLGAIGNFSDAINYATGEWLMFLGADDGLQTYFFEIAEVLTDICKKEKLRVIGSSRAHFFWGDVSKARNNKIVQFTARKEFSILSSKKESFLTLIGAQAYFELPQMYCNSMFHCSLISEAKEKQRGHVFLTVPPDANLAAIAMSLEPKYLKSFIPLGWVGTSACRSDYPGKDSDANGYISDGVSYKREAGKPSINSLVLFYWNALLSAELLIDLDDNEFLRSRLFKYVILSSAYSELRKKAVLIKRKDLFDKLVENNKLSFGIIIPLSYIVGGFSALFSFQRRVVNKIKNIFMPSYQLKLERFDGACMFEESLRISEKLSNILDWK
ncbi:glycosyltransferase family 2 protein [Vibrio sp. PNB23_22_7]